MSQQGVSKTFSGRFNGSGRRFALVAGRFNSFITEQLVAGAKDALMRHGVDQNDIDLAWVPGAFELPLAAQRLAASRKYDAVLCLGTIIRGATPHFDYVSSGAASGISQAALNTGVPIIFGVLTTDTVEQAVERAGTKAGNKGWDAALAALEMADLLAQMPPPASV